MTAPVRVAGRSRDAAGRLVVWSVAEGARGRRWREAVLDAASMALARSLTLETSADGAHVKLEIAAAAGLITLHPEPDGLVHGNVVSADGVHPIEVDAGPAPVFDLPESILVTAALCWTLEPLVKVGGRREVVVIRLDLAEPTQTGLFRVARQDLHVERPEEGTWRLGRSGLEPREVLVDVDGLPVGSGAVRWPLEEPGED